MENMKIYCDSLFNSIKRVLLSDKSIAYFGNADKFSRIYFNALFQMEKIQTLIDV